MKNLILVVNYDCPNHYEDYVHRCGRTGENIDTCRVAARIEFYHFALGIIILKIRRAEWLGMSFEIRYQKVKTKHVLNGLSGND